MHRLLYVTWDGPEQRYLESLYLPILGGLNAHGWRTHVVQFRWGPTEAAARIGELAAAVGVTYEAREVLRRPVTPGAALTVLRGARIVRDVVRETEAELLWARSLFPAAMVVTGPALPNGCAFVFDADGFMADERVEFGGWSARGGPYRVLREVENRATRRATRVLTRTEAAKRLLVDRAGVDGSRIIVVPNARDATVCHPGTAETRARAREALTLPPEAPVIVYAGSLGPQYQPERIFELLRGLQTRRPDVHLVLLTADLDGARRAAARAGADLAQVRMRSVPAAEVAPILACADLGLAFREATPSQRAVCPIKIAEYLLSGLPIVYSRGVGDLDERLAPETAIARAVGADTSLDSVERWWLEEVLPAREAARGRAREVGRRHYDLERVVARTADALRSALPSRRRGGGDDGLR